MAHQARYDLLVFLRDPAATFFTLALPIIFLVIFVAIFGNERGRTGVDFATYYVPGIVALAVVSATFVSLAISLTEEREMGLLKRLRATPLPGGTFVAGRVLTAVAVGLAMTVVLVALGRVLYGVDVPGGTLPGFVVTLAVGAAAFSALGIALTAVIPTANSAPAIANAITLPLFFVSGIFVPAEETPEWLQTVAGVFPLKPFAEALFEAFDPATSGLGLAWGDLAVVAGWGLAGAAAAMRGFRWTPRATA